MSHSMKIILTAFCAGGLFALGLIVGGMSSPHYIQGFLNFGGLFFPRELGAWYPRLAFIMISAIAIMFFVFKLTHPKTKKKPLLNEKFNLPTNTKIDKKLILGSIIFGAGWGLGGYCPGPAIAVALTKNLDLLIFIVFMLIGMFVAKKISARIS